jgi:hypothetical protein
MERQTQYSKGWDDAVEATIQVLTAAKMAYPRVPEVDDLKVFMDPELAVTILEAVNRFAGRMADEIAKRIADEASA